MLAALEEYKLQEIVSENFYPVSDTLGHQNGFMIAAAVTSFDGNEESIEDEEIGTIKFFLKSWNMDSNDGLKWTELESRPCEPDDFK